jgi:hypothetical protein
MRTVKYTCDLCGADLNNRQKYEINVTFDTLAKKHDFCSYQLEDVCIPCAGKIHTFIKSLITKGDIKP